MNCSCKIPRGCTNGYLAPKLCKIHKRIALEMIDKCIWWAKDASTNTMYNAAYQQCGKDMLVRFNAGRARVERGEPFDIYTEIND